MTRAAKFRSIMDESIDAPVGYDKKTYGMAVMLNGLKNGNSLQHAEGPKSSFPDQTKTKQTKNY